MMGGEAGKGEEPEELLQKSTVDSPWELNWHLNSVSVTYSLCTKYHKICVCASRGFISQIGKMKFVQGERDLKYEAGLSSQHSKAVTGGLHDIAFIGATPNRLKL